MASNLPHPLQNLGLAYLRQVVHALLGEGVDTPQVGVLIWRLGAPLHDDSRVRLQDHTIINNLVDGEGDEVVVLDDGALVDRLLEEEVEGVAEGEEDVVEEDFVFFDAADDVDCHVSLHLIKHDPVVE